MANKVNPQDAVNALFADRVFEPKKVEWMEVLYPKVNSKEYWLFRKTNGMTHHDYTVAKVANAFDHKPTRDEIIAHLVKTYVGKAWRPGDLEVQVAQFLGQLTFRGWSGLINQVQKIWEGRS